MNPTVILGIAALVVETAVAAIELMKEQKSKTKKEKMATKSSEFEKKL